MSNGKKGSKKELIKTIVIIVLSCIVVALGVILFGMLGKMKDEPTPPEAPSGPPAPPAAAASAEMPTYDLAWM